VCLALGGDGRSYVRQIVRGQLGDEDLPAQHIHQGREHEVDRLWHRDVEPRHPSVRQADLVVCGHQEEEEEEEEEEATFLKSIVMEAI